jgi:hypothetical protein
VAPPGNQAANGENKPQPVASGETGLLDSFSGRGFFTILTNRFNNLTLSGVSEQFVIK